MYLIDVNLPWKFSLWQEIGAIHQRSINSAWPDSRIWEYARTHNMTIITKDTDFSTRVLLHTPPPKVIWLRFGNVSMPDFYRLMYRLWPDIAALNVSCKLVNVFADRIEGFD